MVSGRHLATKLIKMAKSNFIKDSLDMYLCYQFLESDINDITPARLGHFITAPGVGVWRKKNCFVI